MEETGQKLTKKLNPCDLIAKLCDDVEKTLGFLNNFSVLEVETTEGGCNEDFIYGGTIKECHEYLQELNKKKPSWNKEPRYNYNYYIVFKGLDNQ